MRTPPLLLAKRVPEIALLLERAMALLRLVVMVVVVAAIFALATLATTPLGLMFLDNICGGGGGG